MSDELPIAFITYTKGPVMYVTSPQWETQFLNWLNKNDSSSGYSREVHTTVAVLCAPRTVHSAEKREATVLTLVKP
jgi:hypothetical protein